MLIAMQRRPYLGEERAVFGIFGKIPGASLTLWAPMPAFQYQVRGGIKVMACMAFPLQGCKKIALCHACREALSAAEFGSIHDIDQV